ncbi:MAG: glycosyltransferase [Rhodothermia bacterium]|nr:MAG: glycosyltransferase [Rhodothermia bacterium]
MDHRQTQIAPDLFDSLDPKVQLIDLSVVIVNYNVRDFLEQALKSVIEASDTLSTEIIVVDNNSADGSVEMVRSKFPEVTLITNQENTGFSQANNMAIRRARGRHLLILNPDTIVQEDTLTRLVSFMDQHPEAGAVGCQILNPDGSFARESRRSFPTPDVAFYRLTGLSRLFPKSRRFGRYNMTYLPADQTAEVDALSGSCMMLRADALSQNHDSKDKPGAGLFDEAFFMYGEDLDLCYRIQKAGWKIFYYPETQIIHYKGESTKKGELLYVRLFYGAMLLFIEKHLDPNRSRFIRFLLRTGIVARAGLSLLKSSLSGATAPFLDFGVVYVTVGAVALLRWIWMGGQPAALFFGSVAPGYALGTVVGIWIAGGYRRSPSVPLRPVFLGIAVGFFVVASASYFIPAIGFSRIVVVVSLPLAAAFLSVWRGIWNANRVGLRKGVLVGDADEASRLAQMIEFHPRPPFTLDGFVTDSDPGNGSQQYGPSRLGRLNQLRDIIRLRGIHDVVFAARGLSNQMIFRTMQDLQDLKVQFRMLHEGSDQVIGKASISQLSMGATLAELPEVVVLRSRKAQRKYDVMMCLGAIVLLPFSPLFLTLARLPIAASLRKLRWLPAVLSGQMSLVGCSEEHLPVIPDTWSLRKGVFSITNTLTTRELDIDDLTRAYWFYVTHQSPSLDADIMIRSLREESSG